MRFIKGQLNINYEYKEQIASLRYKTTCYQIISINKRFTVYVCKVEFINVDT